MELPLKLLVREEYSNGQKPRPLAEFQPSLKLSVPETLAGDNTDTKRNPVSTGRVNPAITANISLFAPAKISVLIAHWASASLIFLGIHLCDTQLIHHGCMRWNLRGETFLAISQCRRNHQGHRTMVLQLGNRFFK